MSLNAQDIYDILEGYCIDREQISQKWIEDARDKMVVPWVERKTGFPLSGALARTVEYVNGTGSSILPLSKRPIVEVHSINLVTNPSNWIYTSPTSVEVLKDEGLLKLKAVLEAWQTYVPAFPRGKMNVKVDYTYGLAAVPDELERAVNNLVASVVLGHLGARTGGGNVSVPGIGRTYGPRGKYGDARTDLEKWAYALLRPYMTGFKG